MYHIYLYPYFKWHISYRILIPRSASCTSLHTGVRNYSMRNQCEMSQEEIYQIARARGYYVPAAQATREEVDHVRSVLSQG